VALTLGGWNATTGAKPHTSGASRARAAHLPRKVRRAASRA